MIQTELKQGLVCISEYLSLNNSVLFSELERFSNNFIANNASKLRAYGARWVGDPLHQWSRQWEYPFVYTEISKHVQRHPRRSVSILDAGSGITFFPFLLEQRFPDARIDCVDSDSSLTKVYEALTDPPASRIRFKKACISNIDALNSSYDIIYCISVLEHTRNYHEILAEFDRLLRPGGRLVLSFDISLDGNADIPIEKALELLKALNSAFAATDTSVVARMLHDSNDAFSSPDLLTTSYICRQHPTWLPWKHPRLSGALASLARGKVPHFIMKQLAVACFVFEKRH